jgi:hypothetical protein
MVGTSPSSGSEPLKLLSEGGLQAPGVDRLLLAHHVDHRRVQYRMARFTDLEATSRPNRMAGPLHPCCLITRQDLPGQFYGRN